MKKLMRLQFGVFKLFEPEDKAATLRSQCLTTHTVVSAFARTHTTRPNEELIFWRSRFLRCLLAHTAGSKKCWFHLFVQTNGFDAQVNIPVDRQVARYGIKFNLMLLATPGHTD